MSQTALTVETEYTERLMSGTGTESDPWIIGGYTDTSHDLQNLLDAIGTSGAYIKLLRDIDAAQDIAYREGIDHTITIAAAKLYAEEKKQISGLIINASNAFLEGGGVHIIENVQFLSIMHYGTGYSFSFVNGDSSKQLYLYDCDFSIIKHCAGGTPSFSVGAIFTNRCTFDYKPITSGDLSLFDVFNTTGEFRNTMIHYDGPLLSYHAGAYSSFAFIRNAHKVGITGFITSPVDRVRLFYSNCDYCYFAGTVNATKSDVTLESSGSNCLLCITEKQGDYDTTVSTSATEIAPEQLKDREYLYSIGFLP